MGTAVSVSPYSNTLEQNQLQRIPKLSSALAINEIKFVIKMIDILNFLHYRNSKC